MKIESITNKNVWNGFVINNNGSFLQSYEWGQFQHAYGRDSQYLAVSANNKIIAGTLLIKHDLPASRGYYFSPYGPIIFHELILEQIREQALKNKVIFWRYENNNISGGISVKAVHPKNTWLLNLADKKEEQVLAAMKPKTRYNIRLAQKKGVKIKISMDIKDIDIFYNLIKQTSQRQKINIFPKRYYQTMLHSLGDNGFLKIYLAEYQNKILAANLMVFFNKTATYLHGGTTYEHHEVMAPHLLQWQAIADAMHDNYHYYDFFGIADNDLSNDPWAGITRFKKGFGGEIKSYLGTYEIPLNNIWYNAYRIAKKI